MLDSEVDIIRSAVSGDASAFGRLYDHYQPQIYRFVVLKVGRREEAEDITHHVFLHAWLNIKQYSHRGHPFGSWLYKIARNKVIDYYRSHKDDLPLEEADPDIFAAHGHELDRVHNKLQMAKVRRVLAGLKEDYQDVILLRFMEELSLKETAAIMKRSEGAIKVLQHRAIKAAKDALDITFEEEE